MGHLSYFDENKDKGYLKLGSSALPHSFLITFSVPDKTFWKNNNNRLFLPISSITETWK